MEGSKNGGRSYVTKGRKVRGDLGAISLGDFAGPKPRVAKRVCKRHRWRVSKFSQQCTVCGLVELR